MNLIRGIVGGIVLFLGRELTFLFAGGITMLFAIRVAPLLPARWPAWSPTAFIIGLGIIAAAIALINRRAGYVVSGFVAGGYFLSEYYAPGIAAVPLLPFVVGSVLGALILGFLAEWGMIVISSIVGAIYLTSLFNIVGTARTLLTAGLVVIGAVIQVIIMRMQKDANDR